MSQDTWNAVDAYISDMLVSEDEVLRQVTKSSSDAGLPPIAVAPNQGKFLQLLVRAMGGRNVLEIGTLGGYSTIWLARGLPPDGRLVTLEVDPKHAEVAQANIELAGLSRVVDIRVGAAIDTLPKLAAEGADPYDFVFIDADKQSTPDYLKWAIQLSRPGSLIVIDNVVRHGGVIDKDSDDAMIQGIRSANEILASDPRVTSTAIQMVGIKGYDGMAIALVTSTK